MYVFVSNIIIRHENASGFYRVSVYFTAKLLCDIFPLRLIPLIFFSVIAYFMLGKIQVLKTSKTTMQIHIHVHYY